MTETELVSTMFVIDTICGPAVPSRTHHALYEGRAVPFEFKSGEPLELPRSVALTFLQTPTFKLTDKNGKEVSFDPTPKQPHELEAGQKLELEDDQVVANIKELTLGALIQRANIMPGGEKLSNKDGKEALMDFIVARSKEIREENSAPDESDPDGFTPPALDEVAA